MHVCTVSYLFLFVEKFNIHDRVGSNITLRRFVGTLLQYIILFILHTYLLFGKHTYLNNKYTVSGIPTFCFFFFLFF